MNHGTPNLETLSLECLLRYSQNTRSCSRSSIAFRLALIPRSGTRFVSMAIVGALIGLFSALTFAH